MRCKSGYGFSAATSQAYSDPDNVETSTCPGTDGLTHENDPNRKVMWENGAPSCTPIKCTIPELPAVPSGKYMYTHDAPVGVFSCIISSWWSVRVRIVPWVSVALFFELCHFS